MLCNVYLDITGLNVNKEIISNNKTDGDPKSKAKETKYGAEETHLNYQSCLRSSLI